MKLSLNWLRELVETNLTPEELAERLTFAGVEVEAIETSPVTLDRIIAVEVTAIHPHPKADRLRLCDVADGSQTVRVVCGAFNFNVGAMVPLAPPGSLLADKTKVRPAVIRGEKSQGMLCSAAELGITDDHGGLMLLPSAIKPGTPLTEIVGTPDTVLTVEITPNRPDCLSLIGIAREIAALCDCRLQRPRASLPEVQLQPDDELQVTVASFEDCPRYMAWRFQDVAAAPSPWWLQYRLHKSGIRPINNVVDITNYVMLETGQPLHAFDQRYLQGGQIHVRRARDGELLATLDGVKRNLTPEMLVIADSERPLALAGIMGGADSGIHDDTQAVVLESACFQSALVRRTGKKLGLASESSYRFERGVDVMQTAWAAQRAASLMIQLSGARLVATPIDCFPVEPSQRNIDCRFANMRRLLGLEISDEEMVDIFESLELKVSSRDKKNCTVCVPSFRADLEQEVDLLEEIARMHGLDKLPEPPPALSVSAQTQTHQKALAVMKLRANLVGMGLTEIMNYSFVNTRLLDLFEKDTGNRVPLLNPISSEHTWLRNSLLPQMVETLGRNRARQVQSAAFFEIGRVFYQPDPQAVSGQRVYSEANIAAQAKGLCAEEIDVLALGLMGAAGRPPLEQRRPVTEEEAWLWLRGILEQLCSSFKFNAAQNFRTLPEELDLQFIPSDQVPAGFVWPNETAFESGRGFVILLEGKPAGRLGLISSVLSSAWRIREPLVVAELMLPALLTRLSMVSELQPIPVYPSVERDLALLAPSEMPHSEILKVIRELAPRELTKIKLFDIFKGKQIGVGYKSLAYALTYRSYAKTLKDEEVNAMHEHIIEGLREKLKIDIRAG